MPAGISPNSDSSTPQPPANLSPKWETKQGLPIQEETSPSPSSKSRTTSTRSGSRGKTSQTSSTWQTTPLASFWEGFLEAQDLPQARLEEEGGRTQVWFLDPKEPLPGVLSMLEVGSLNNGEECSLSLVEVLETCDVPLRFSRSPKACAGLLRRAINRKRTLSPAIRKCLEALGEK